VITLFVISSRLSAQCTSDRYLDTIFPFVSKSSQILYGNADPYLGSRQDLFLDFYEPTGDTLRHRPLIVYAFGGAFLIGDKNQPPIPEYCRHFAKAGFAVVAIDYRIGFNVASSGSAERAVVRAVQDLRAAIRFLCQRSSQFGIDTGAIFLTGSSAGCISGIHSAFMRESEVPASSQGILLEPSDLGCMDCSGNNDFYNRVPKPRGILNHWGAILDTTFITSLPEDNVPVLSVHGDADPLVPYNTGNPFSYPVFPNVYGSAPIHDRLNRLGIKNKLVVLRNYLHEAWLTNREVLDSAFTNEIPFMYEILKPTPQIITGDSIACIGEIVTYTALSRDLSRYCFTLSSGGVIVAQNAHQITVNWTTAGVHTISVREMNKNEVNGDLAFFSVRVIDRPIANFGVSINALTVACIDSSIGAISWNYNYAPFVVYTSQNPTHTYSSPGVNYIRQIVSNGYCKDTAFRMIDVDTCPRAIFTYTIVGDSVYFLGLPSNGVRFEWIFGDGSKDTAILNPVHGYANTQNYLVGFSVTNSKGCKTTSSQIIPYTKPTSITEKEKEFLPFYPNPVSNIIVFKANGRYVLYDVNGSEIFNKEISISEAVNLNFLSAGVYHLKRIEGKSILVFKILKL
jgi:PKD repeat protein/pimeloyl-ACP methyl ester carboxylesterase